MEFIDLKSQQRKIRKQIDGRIRKVLDRGKYINGPEVIELEEKLAKYVGVKHCISCSSGTDALLIPLMAYEIGKGDAVITSPFTYIATAEVVRLLGAVPIFADIYTATFNINPSEIANAITKAHNNGLKPKGIIPVDLFGLPARYREIEEIASENDLFVIEDAAQGFGSEIKGKKSGSFGHVASTSFFPAKPLGCYGDGGAIFTNNDDIADKMRSIRVHGSGVDKYQNVRLGINGRLDTIQAAILLEKLSIFDDEINSRNKIANYYSKNINAKYDKPYIPKGYFSSWAQYSLTVNSEMERVKVLELLKRKGIPAMVYYKIPLHLQKVFKNLGNSKGDFPISENIASRIFSIPMHPYLNKMDQDVIIEILNG